MSLIVRMRKQKAVYWARSTDPDRYGRYSYASPVEIKCRWEDGSKEFRNAQGEQLNFDATVYVDRVTSVGDMLKKGEMDSNTVEDPRQDRDAKMIQRVEETPNLRNTQVLHTVYV